MKIVHLCSMDFGGAGKAAYRLHKGLQEIGVDSSMIVMCKKTSDDSVHAIPSEVPLSHEKWWSLLTNVWERSLADYPLRSTDNELFSEFCSVISLEPLQEIIRSADIINLHWVAGFFNASLMSSSLLNKKIVWTLHDMNPFTGGCHYAGECNRYRDSCGACPQLASDDPKDLSFSGWTLKQQGYLNLDITVVTPSRWLGGCSGKSSLLGRFSHKIIPYGFPLNTFRPVDRQRVRSELNISPDARVVLFCADSTATKRKGFSYLLDALQLLSELGRGENLVLAVVGIHDNKRQEACGYPVLSFGHISDEEQMALLYNAADVFVLPSLEDNLPNTVVEALACGTPVAAFNIGGIPDMVDHGITGYLAPARDASGLADAIEWCINSEPEEIRHSCRAKAEGHFTLEIQAQNYKKLYDSITTYVNQKQVPAIRKTVPKISIVTPSFNQAQYLEECIKSILSQNYPNLEYIIMDGGSTDGSVDIIRKYEKHLAYWQSQPDGGQYQAISAGFKRSTGEIMGWLNSDDKLHPGGLQVISEVFSQLPQVEFLTGKRIGFDEHSQLKSFGYERQLWCRKVLLQKELIHKQSLFIMQEATYWRRDLWEKAGSTLDFSFGLAADFELWLRFSRYAQLYTVDALIGGFRYYSADQRCNKFRAEYINECDSVIDRELRMELQPHSLYDTPPPIIPYPLYLPISGEASRKREEPQQLTITMNSFQDFAYAKKNHFAYFKDHDAELFNYKIDPNYCDLKAYQDLLVFTFIKENIPKGAKILDIGGGDSRILKYFKDNYECWNIDKLEGVGNGPLSVVHDGYHLVRDYIGNFNDKLPENYFDFIFSISTLEHVPDGRDTHKELYKNICLDIDRVLKPGGITLHCFDITISDKNRCWTNEFVAFMSEYFAITSLYVPIEEVARDPELYVISECFFKDYWTLPNVKWKYEDGKPSSQNLLWRKPIVPMSCESNNRWSYYNKFRTKKNNDYPKISVVTPSFNQADFLEECIESILGQNYPNLEYIIMDGGSTDGSVDIIRRYSSYISYWQSQADGGQYQAINDGFLRSSGEIMTWLNSDDKFHPGAFETAARVFVEHSETQWIMGRPNGFDEKGNQSWIYDYLPLWSREKYLQKQYRDPYIQQEGTFWRRGLWEKAGGYLRPDLKFAGDLELWTRFFRYAQLYTADALLAGYRQHSQQKMAQNIEKYHQEAEAVLDFERELFQHAQNKTLLPAPLPIRKIEVYNDIAEHPIKSNLDFWKKIQDGGYFEKHPCYGGLVAAGDEHLKIKQFVDLLPDMNAVVIGCGYGRDTLPIAPHVKVVYGIDVTSQILQKAVTFLRDNNVTNFVPVLADEWKTAIPQGIDFVFTVVVFQHLTRDLVRDYIWGLAQKLSDRGVFICQFADLDYGTADADLKLYEPSVRWSIDEIDALIRQCGLIKYRIVSELKPGNGYWHWAYFGKTERK